MARSSIQTLALLLAGGTFLTTQPGVGCVDTTTTTNGKTTSHRQIDGDVSDGGDTTDHTDPNYIPRRAQIVQEGKGQLLYTANDDGQLYVQDLKNETLLITQRVHRGQTIAVSPDDNRIKLDDDTISKIDLKSDHVHRIYLLRDGRFSDRDRSHDRREDDSRDRDADNDNRNQIHINDRDVGPYNEHGVPAKATMMDQGLNREMTFVTGTSGRVYIFDVNANRVAATVDMDARQVFKFSPGIDRVTIDGKRVPSADFDPQSQYRIYFNH